MFENNLAGKMLTLRRILLAIAALLFVVFEVFAMYRFAENSGMIDTSAGKDVNVAVIHFDEQITPEYIDRMIKRIEQIKERKEKFKEILITFGSPGGSPSASHDFAVYLEKSKHDIPITYYVSDVAASGSYYVACTADEIIANPNAWEIRDGIGKHKQYSISVMDYLTEIKEWAFTAILTINRWGNMRIVKESLKLPPDYTIDNMVIRSGKGLPWESRTIPAAYAAIGNVIIDFGSVSPDLDLLHVTDVIERILSGQYEVDDSDYLRRQRVKSLLNSSFEERFRTVMFGHNRAFERMLCTPDLFDNTELYAYLNAHGKKISETDKKTLL